MKMFNAIGSELIRMDTRSQTQKQSFVEESFMYGGITAVFICFEFLLHNQPLGADLYSQCP